MYIQYLHALQSIEIICFVLRSLISDLLYLIDIIVKQVYYVCV